jgi:hypothetical protein
MKLTLPRANASRAADSTIEVTTDLNAMQYDVDPKK